MKIDFVFVVLVYRNTHDLKDFFESFDVPNSKIIIVNSFYDLESEQEFKHIADTHNADFLSVSNQGYGYGNNRGCEHALRHYDFRFLIISNPDIKIQRLSLSALQPVATSIVAPKITTLKGKNQNPLMPFSLGRLNRWKYLTFSSNRRFIFLLFCIWARLCRIAFFSFFFLFGKKYTQIYAAHGAFVIIPRSIVEQLHPIYNEEMFLFCEEEQLAQLAGKHRIKTVYLPAIKIVHKENGSMSFLSESTFELTRKSFMILYETWFK